MKIQSRFALAMLLASALPFAQGCDSVVGDADDGRSRGEVGATGAPGVTGGGTSEAVCDPFGKSQGTGAGQGLVAHLSYLEGGGRDYRTVSAFEEHATPVDARLFFSQLNVPTRPFDEGFTTQSGKAITTGAGDTLYEYFALRFESILKLGPGDEPGDYQFALLSDDGSVLRLDPDGQGLRVALDDDGVHPSRLSCARRTVHLDADTRIPMRLDYFQGPRYHIALVLLWRKVGPSHGAGGCQASQGQDQDDERDEEGDSQSALSDPACGRQGNGTFFDYTQSPSAPTRLWNDFLSRGWKVLSPGNYELPATAGDNPCAQPAVPSCFTDRFTQPTTGRTSSVDLLFVTDSSSDGDYDRPAVADALGSFVGALPGGTDYRVGVMLGHGGRSSFSGRLWHHGATDDVLRSDTMPLSRIQSELRSNLGNLAHDYSSNDGEEGLYSLSRGLDQGPLASSRAHGFFRTEAALSVVFVSDDPDICSHPSGEDDFSYAFQHDCPGITPSSVLAKLRALQGDRPLALAAITQTRHYIDPEEGEDEFGAGYIDLMSIAHGSIVDIPRHDYGQALAAVGQATSDRMTVLYRFALTHGNVDPASVQVSVDGTAASFSYESAPNDVYLPQPGHAGSTVVASYCQLGSGPGPSPSPSASPSVVPSPSPSTTPSVTPSPSPSAAPSVVPSPSPSVAPSVAPSPSPSAAPSVAPSPSPSVAPSVAPSPSPSSAPSSSPSPSPSPSPSGTPCSGPSCGGGGLGV